MKKQVAFTTFCLSLLVFVPSAAATVVYDFSGQSNSWGLSVQVPQDFTYMSPDFITSERPVPATDLGACFTAEESCTSVVFDPFTGRIALYTGPKNTFYQFQNTSLGSPGVYSSTTGRINSATLTITAGPEPASLSLVTGALALLALTARRIHGSVTSKPHLRRT